jgi:toxin ParE1/3/4
LTQILAWLEEHSPAAAERFADAFEARTALLTSQPNTGRERDDLHPGLRSVVVEGYVVFFEPTNDDIIIHHVLHGSRNITPDLFTNE